ncbi:abortive infection family protein [Microbacterium sp. SSW1-59]|uniref:abortive infection family protein n=1 Tax=Microbacterium xanthum TaxID=3079794 RepID=UPI002AD339ED|nr:abortive infection family protein [Microbacterium sp. SSW1-59]MDZ8202696.1 abortive infection family protein [Microbacterium sp. SSW1-59]
MSPRPSHRVTRPVRNNLFDWLSLSEYNWSGRMEHPDFLARLYDLDSLPSTDSRYRNAAGDIAQHMVRNYDWEDDWVFGDARFNLRGGSDENFLNFLAATVHPIVRTHADDAAAMVEAYNATLRRDNFELYEVDRLGDRVIYGWRETTVYRAPSASQIAQQPDLTENAVLRQHLGRIERDLESDPPAAIASCKNLIESQCKIVLTDLGIEYGRNDEMPKLFGKVASALAIDAASVPTDPRGSNAVKRAMGSLSGLVTAIAEARNAIGSGHGADTLSAATPKHARLVFNSTVAVAQFVADTWHETSRWQATDDEF